MTTMFLAALLGQATMAKPAAASSQSLFNVKRLCLATLMYTQDNGETLPHAANFKKAVSRYVKDPTIFTAPGAPKGSVDYFFEPRLSGKKITAIMSLAETAMILEGGKGNPVFPYAGRTVVGYVDGHAKLVNAKAAMTARTKPLR